MKTKNSSTWQDDDGEDAVATLPEIVPPVTAPEAGELPPVIVQAVAAAPAVDIADAELDATPTTLAETLALLRRVQAMPDRADKAYRKIKADRIEKLCRIHHQLSNQAPPTEQPLNLSDRAQALFDKVVLVADEPISRLREFVHSYHCVLASYQDRGLLPLDQKRHLDLIDGSIGTATSADEIDALLAKKARVLLIAQTPNATTTAARQINTCFDAMKPVVAELEAAFKLAIDAQEAELIEIEKRFFESQGAKHHRTGVSDFVATVRTRLAQLTAPFHHQIAQHANTMNPARVCVLEKNAFADLFRTQV